MTKFFCKIFYLYLESSRASREWKNSNVVIFTDPVHKVGRDPSVSLRLLLDKNSKYCKETVKWRTANLFTVKQLTICTGISNLGITSYRKLGRSAHCIKGENGLEWAAECFTAVLVDIAKVIFNTGSRINHSYCLSPSPIFEPFHRFKIIHAN